MKAIKTGFFTHKKLINKRTTEIALNQGPNYFTHTTGLKTFISKEKICFKSKI
jgi:hypothetical protein